MATGHTVKALLLAFTLLLLAPSAEAADHAFYQKTHDGYLLPDHHVTPGAIAHHDLATICNTQWGQNARAVTAAMKAEAYRRYRATKTAKVCCEVDHLNSRDTGGADVQENLWPQPWAEARLKDRVETEAEKRVCAGQADLAEMQRTMATDLTLLYREWFGPLPSKP